MSLSEDISDGPNSLFMNGRVEITLNLINFPCENRWHPKRVKQKRRKNNGLCCPLVTRDFPIGSASRIVFFFCEVFAYLSIQYGTNLKRKIKPSVV